MEVAVRRPQRWDAPLSPAMRDVDVDHLLAIEPFRSIDPAAFPASLPLRDILKNDARILPCQPGDVVVREGDYGSSAFLVLSGRVRVAVAALADETLGRQTTQKLSWLAALRAMLARPKLPEVRRTLSAGDGAAVKSPPGAGLRGDPQRPTVFLQDVPRILEASQTVALGPGELFGELAALTRSPRSATVFAENDAVLLEIRWQGLRDVMRRSDALRRHVERLYRENSLRVHLRETPLLGALPAERLSAVAEATIFEAHGEFDWHGSYEPTVPRSAADRLLDEPLIAEEGRPVDGLILIRTGFARISQRYGAGHRTISYAGRGQVFALAEALAAARTGRPVLLGESLRALGYVDVLRIPQAVLAEHVLPFVSQEQLAQLNEPRHAAPAIPEASRGLATPAAGEASAQGQSLLEFLVDRRLINGQSAMAIDLDRCTRCDDCVRACAATHDNNPRFVRSGLRHGPLMIAEACMHCVDPVCMIGCPTGAIGRDAATGVVRINDPTCVGCSTCADSCPYHNIRMVAVRDRRGAVVLDVATAQPISKATKCDLCVDQPGGPACQRACPHDALVRLDLGNLGEVSAFVSR